LQVKQEAYPKHAAQLETEQGTQLLLGSMKNPAVELQSKHIKFAEL
jgi:hypothetical protein